MVKTKPKLALVVHNVRSAHNVGSLLRTSEGLGIDLVYLTGYTPYPETRGDKRLPHIRQRLSKQIHKTALGAEKQIAWRQTADIQSCLRELVDSGYTIAALEQTAKARPINEYEPGPDNVALVVGSEVGGLDSEFLEKIRLHLEIPMNGKKESFNVAVASAMALYHLRFGR